MDDRALIRSLEGFHNKRFLALVGLALLVFAVVVGRIVVGFHNNDVPKSTDAMTRVGSSSSARPAASAK
jgi:hypothetical protein